MEPCVRREIVFRESVEALWEAVTDPERLAEWFANEAELDLRVGGAGVFRWGDGSVRLARVEAVEHERRLALLWRDEGGNDAPTRVELTLEEVPEGTRLTVVESATLPATGPRAMSSEDASHLPGAPRSSAARALVGEWSWALAMLALVVVSV